MGFISGMIVGVAVGIGLIVAYARHESIRSKRRSDLVCKNQNPHSLHSNSLASFVRIMVWFL